MRIRTSAFLATTSLRFASAHVPRHVWKAAEMAPFDMRARHFSNFCLLRRWLIISPRQELNALPVTRFRSRKVTLRARCFILRCSPICDCHDWKAAASAAFCMRKRHRLTAVF